MAQIARRLDEHAGVCSHGEDCCPHSVVGIITGGSPDSYIDGRGVARLGDTVTHNCPHCGIGNIATASSTMFINKLGVARKGDVVIYPGGSGTITTGSENITVGS